MHAIYHNAALVVIWLQLRKEEQRCLRKVAKSHDRPRLMPRVVHRLLQKRLSSYRDIIWSAMENPYWGRVWIVQEVVVARKVCVAFGDMSLDLDDFLAVVDPFRGTRFPAGKPSMWVLCNMRAAGGKMPLWRMLRDFTGHQSSRPVDRVYGLLGMVENHSDGSSPVQHIHVDYDRPLLHVLLDAMFESTPPLTEYKLATSCLGPWNTYDSLELLEGYIASSTTLQRHKDFAKLALQAFEAFNIIKSVPGAPHTYLMSDLIDDLLTSAAETGWEPTWREGAAIIGILLAKWSKHPLEHWQARRRLRGETSSPWRCLVHQSRYVGHPASGSHELTAGVTRGVVWNLKGIVAACEECSQSCTSLAMSCEMPDVGLRLSLDSYLGHGVNRILSLRRNLRKNWLVPDLECLSTRYG